MTEKLWKSLYEVFGEHGDTSINVWACNPEQALVAAHQAYFAAEGDITGTTLNAIDLLTKVDEEGELAYLRGKYSFEYHGYATRYKSLFVLREAYTDESEKHSAVVKQVHSGMLMVKEVSGQYTFKNFEGEYRLYSTNAYGEKSIRWCGTRAKAEEILAFYGWVELQAPNRWGYPEGLIVVMANQE